MALERAIPIIDAVELQITRPSEKQLADLWDS
jgi:hypothetical protein